MNCAPTESLAHEGRPPPRNRRGLRTGYTTGACAAAAAKAAALALLTGRPIDEVEIALPIGRRVGFRVARCEVNGDGVTCGVVKDAGDDPDVTHGAEIRATVSRDGAAGIRLARGEGVGVVTRPGLGLEVGGPAINPVPRQMIVDSAGEAIALASAGGVGLRVAISVPNGEELARKTLNARLGILGGISILGTTGIVQPYSTAAYKASITLAIDVAVAAGCDQLVLTTGGRSERFARATFPELPEIAFVQMGDFVGFALRYCLRTGVRRVTIGGFVGKISKTAHGHLQTHAAGGEVDIRFLAEVAADCGASPGVVEQLGQANTARHFQEMIQADGLEGVFGRLCRLCREHCLAEVARRGGSLDVGVVLYDFNGHELGRAL